MNGPAASGPRHVSVMPAEVLELLAPAAGQVVVDCTTGAGGHTRLLAERVGPTGRVIALDRDPAMLDLARPRLEGLSVTLVHAGFDELHDVLAEQKIANVDAVLADLGICSDQLDSSERGFSFGADGPLDMRMDPTQRETAANLVARLSERELADVIFQYGEERFSRRIARRIVEMRKQTPFTTTEQLAEVVRRCVPRPKGKPGIDTATRTFQALRIAVNDEMAALATLLSELPRCLKPGGRAALISFHSLEDRQVKRAFADRDRWQVLTKKPLQAGEPEVESNPRSRSAKLRGAVLKPTAAP